MVKEEYEKKNINRIGVKTSNKIYYLYFVLTFMILAIHSLKVENFNEANEFSKNLNHILNILFNMGVPTFFMLSAFLFFYKDCTQQKYFSVVIKKIKTLIVPYILWNVLACPFKIIKDYVFTKEIEINFSNIVKKVVFSEWNQVLWFLRVLFIYVLIFPVINHISKKKIFCPILVISLVIINLLIGPTIGYSTIRYWLPIYLLGAYLINNFRDDIFKEKNIFKHWYSYGVILVMLGSLLICAFYNDYFLYIARMICPILIWILSDIFLTEKKPNWYIRQTFFYYGAQLFVADFVSMIFIKFFGKGSIQLIVATFILPTVNMIIMIFAAMFCNKFFNRFYCILTGNRGVNMKKEKKLKICLVGSSGGHLTHLTMLKDFYDGKDRVWVTFDKEDANSILKNERVYHCYFPTNRNIKNLIKNTFLAIKVLRKEKPNLIISSGAAVAIPFFYIGKLFGAKLVYIEVFDRIDKSTVTGKIVYPITDKFIVQWEEMKKVYPKSINMGSIF